MAANQWTAEEDKIFEQMLAYYTEDAPDRWEMIALHVNKTVAEVIEHYDALFFDIELIDSGFFDEPNYFGNSTAGQNSTSPISSGSAQEDKKQIKGRPWSKHEHKLFLIGLERYGKGDWKSISRNVVLTRTARQIASHAQKYFNWQKSQRKKRKRSSINDITIDDTSLAIPPSNMDCTGQQETPIHLQLQHQPQPSPRPQDQSISMEEFQPQLPSNLIQDLAIHPSNRDWTGQQETPIYPQLQNQPQLQVHLQAQPQPQPYPHLQGRPLSEQEYDLQRRFPF